MEADQNGESRQADAESVSPENLDAAQEAAEKEVGALAEESSVSLEDTGELPGQAMVNAIDKEILDNVYKAAEESVDLTGSQEVTNSQIDESGAIEAAEDAGEQITFNDEQDDLADGQEDSTEFDMPESEKVVQNDKYAEEKPITHVKNMENNQVFEITPDLMKRRDLFPCDEDGKLVPDHRCFN